MKPKFFSFFAGVLTAALLSTLTVSALAANSALTITAYPIQVLVNGEVFQPKDAKGNEVLVFNSGGTVYAPVRALAEAYGLEVGYDASRRLVTVSQTSDTDFSSQWTVKERPVSGYTDEKVFSVKYSGPLDREGFMAWWKSLDMAEIETAAEEMAAEAQSQYSGYNVTLYFTYDTYNLGNAYIIGGYPLSNFEAANAWIK